MGCEVVEDVNGYGTQSDRAKRVREVDNEEYM